MSISSMLQIIYSMTSSSSLNKMVVVSVTIFVALLCICILIGHLLEKNRWTNESIISLLLGLATGAVVLLASKGKSSKIFSFNEDLFFIYLLPPIIFNAGFQVKKKQFFKNFSTILLFGVFGTLISFCLITVGALVLFKRIGAKSLSIKDYLAIGAILSATDSVSTLQVLSQDQTPFLYSIVFGEGVVNDATSIVLFNSVQSLDFSDLNALTSLKLLGKFLYLYFTSTAIGIAVGLLSAFGIKTFYFGRHSTDREVAIMILMAYLSYMLAELFSLSGILTIFFCGIVMSHYTWHNVTENSRVTTKHAFATISFISETFIFLYVGLDALDIQKWKLSNASAGTSFAISSTMFALVLVGRAAFVFPISNLLNCTKGDDAKIDMRKQFVIWWAGLMRGAVTIALSYNQFSKNGQSCSPEQALMITSIIIVVLFSTTVCGSITKPLIEVVLLKNMKPVTSDAAEFDSLEDLRLLFLESENLIETSSSQAVSRRNSLRLLMRYPTFTIHHFWRKFDDRFMRPVFGGRGFVPFVLGSPTSETDHIVADPEI